MATTRIELVIEHNDDDDGEIIAEKSYGKLLFDDDPDPIEFNIDYFRFDVDRPTELITKDGQRQLEISDAIFYNFSITGIKGNPESFHYETI